MNEFRLITNIERFIHEISTRSCIWNTRCIDYKSKIKRKQAWEEICNVFFINFQHKNKTRREHLCRILQRKWKSIRDTYVRDLRKNGEIRYVYGSSLAFLRNSVRINRPPNMKSETDEDFFPDEDEQAHAQEEVENENEDNDDDDEMIFQRHYGLFSFSQPDISQSNNSNSDSSTYLDVQRLNEPKISSPFPEQNMNTIQNSEEGDEDRMFLLSLLKDLKKIPEHNKLEAKSELLLVLNKWKKSNAQVWCEDTT